MLCRQLSSDISCSLINFEHLTLVRSQSDDYVGMLGMLFTHPEEEHFTPDLARPQAYLQHHLSTSQ